MQVSQLICTLLYPFYTTCCILSTLPAVSFLHYLLYPFYTTNAPCCSNSHKKSLSWQQ